MRLSLAGVGSAVAGAAMIVTSSCGTDSSGTIVPRDAGFEAAAKDAGVDHVAPVDAGIDSPADATDAAPPGCDFASCTGACCQGVCQPAQHDCSACGSTLFCPLAVSAEVGDCVTTCSACATGSVGCHGRCQAGPDCD